MSHHKNEVIKVWRRKSRYLGNLTQGLLRCQWQFSSCVANLEWHPQQSGHEGGRANLVWACSHRQSHVPGPQRSSHGGSGGFCAELAPKSRFPQQIPFLPWCSIFSAFSLQSASATDQLVHPILLQYSIYFRRNHQCLPYKKCNKPHLGTSNGGLCHIAFVGSNKLNQRTNATPSIAANVVLVGSTTYVAAFQEYILLQ